MNTTVGNAIQALAVTIQDLSRMDRYHRIDLTLSVDCVKNSDGPYEENEIDPDDLDVGDLTHFDYITLEGEPRRRAGIVTKVFENGVLIYDLVRMKPRRSRFVGMRNVYVVSH